MKNIFLLLFIIIATNIFSQNKQVLYNFANLPQTLLNNPGADIKYNSHIGIPLFSNFSIETGTSGILVSDLFAVNSKPINTKVLEAVNKLSYNDDVKVNFQIDVFNFGYRYGKKNYFSIGFYEEIDLLVHLPKDAIKFLTQGSSLNLNKKLDLSNVVFKADALGVLHFGLSRKMNDKLTLGARFKIYSSVINAESFNSSGTLETVSGVNNILTHKLKGFALNINTSNTENIDKNDPLSYLKKTFFGGNLGIGFDFGFTYHKSKQLEFTGSIIDLGFIKYNKNIKNYHTNGDYEFNGVGFDYDSETSRNYWQEIEDDFTDKVPTNENSDSYVSFRPLKLNASFKYKYNKTRSIGKDCYPPYKEYYKNAYGVQLYSVFRPLGMQFVFTSFYEIALTSKLRTKFTHTIDKYSFFNVGAGVSAQLGRMNFYGMIGNIEKLYNLASAKSVSLQLGASVIF